MKILQFDAAGGRPDNGTPMQRRRCPIRKKGCPMQNRRRRHKDLQSTRGGAGPTPMQNWRKCCQLLPGSPKAKGEHRTHPPCRMRVGPGPTPMRNRRSPTPRSPYTRGSPQPSPMPRRRNAIREKGRPRRKGSKWMEEEHFGLSALGLSGPPHMDLAMPKWFPLAEVFPPGRSGSLPPPSAEHWAPG